MRAPALSVVLLAHLGLILAHPHLKHHQNGKRLVEEIVEIEEVVYEDVNVVVYGPAPDDYSTEGTPTFETSTAAVSSWLTTQSDGATPAPIAAGQGPKDKELQHQPAPNSQSAGPLATTTDAGSPSIAGGSSPSDSSLGSPATASSPPAVVDPLKDRLKVVSNPVVASSSSSAPAQITGTQKGNGALIDAVYNPKTSAAFSATESPSSSAQNVASSTAPVTGGKFPFKALVAFGDNLSDNGNGSYAHHVTDKNDPNNKVYGAGTWTNAQVAVSYLTDLLGVPMNQNFAFGHAWGGSVFGATIDNTIAVSDFHNPTVAAELGCPGAPPASQQIDTYIKGGVNKDAIHFLWIGNNDVNLNTISTGSVSYSQDRENAFVGNVSTKIAGLASKLLDAGAPYVFVANLYPKHLAPITPKYYYMNTSTQWDALGVAINKANTALETALTASQFSGKVLYYDAFSYMTSIWNSASDNGMTDAKDTNGFPAFCDGDPDKTADTEAAIAAGTIPIAKDTNNWGTCVDLHEQEKYYWMQYLDPTSKVHKLVSADMAARIGDHFSK